MSESVHILVVRAGGLPWALPMNSVEQTFDLRSQVSRRVGTTQVVRFRGTVIELVNLADRLGQDPGSPAAAVVVWAAGRRRAFAVDELVGQLQLERLEPARLGDRRLRQRRRPPRGRGDPDPRARGRRRRVVRRRAEPIRLHGPSAERAARGREHRLRARGDCALQLLGRPVDISYSEALLTVLAEAIDQIGSPMSRSALVDTPIQDDGGTVLLVFPDDAGEQLCQLLGTSLSDELGRPRCRRSETSSLPRI